MKSSDTTAISQSLRQLYLWLSDNFDAGTWWPADTRFEILVGAVLPQDGQVPDLGDEDVWSSLLSVRGIGDETADQAVTDAQFTLGELKLFHGLIVEWGKTVPRESTIGT